LTHLIQSQPDMKLVREEPADPVELLLAVRRRRAKVVIVPLEDPEAVRGVSSHLLSEHPDLLVLGLSLGRGESVAYRRSVTERRVEAFPAESLLRVIRTTRLGDD
jgi:hypothetical protein